MVKTISEPGYEIHLMRDEAIAELIVPELLDHTEAQQPASASARRAPFRRQTCRRACANPSPNDSVLWWRLRWGGPADRRYMPAHLR